MINKKTIALLASLLWLPATAHAQSTINTGQPAQNSNLSSLVIRQLAQAAATDINGIISGHAASSLGSCPATPTVFEDCLVVGSSPYSWYKWTGSTGGYGLVGTLNPTTGLFGVALSPGSVAVTAPITVSFSGGTATLGFDYSVSGIFTAAQTVTVASGALPAAQTGTVFRVAGADGATARMELDGYGTGATTGVPRFTCVRGDGTRAAPTGLKSGDEICSLNVFGYNGAGTNVGPQAAIRTYATQDWSVGSNGTRMALCVTPNGSATCTDYIGIGQDGTITFGATSSNVVILNDKISGDAGNSFIQFAGSNTGFGGNGGFTFAVLENCASNCGLSVAANRIVGFSSVNAGGSLPGAQDVAISRLGAASLAIGNGTLGDFSGSLKAATFTGTGGSTFGTVAIGGATIGSNALAVTGPAQFGGSTNTTINSNVVSGSAGSGNALVQFGNSNVGIGGNSLYTMAVIENGAIGVSIAANRILGFSSSNASSSLVGAPDTAFSRTTSSPGGWASLGNGALGDASGTMFLAALNASSQVAIGSGQLLRINAPSDGVGTLTNNAGTTFGRLQLGGTSASFPALRRNLASIDFRLADDSAFTRINANRLWLDSGGPIFWNQGAGSQIYSTTDGNLLFSNNAGTAAFFILGQNTSSFPAIKRSGAAIAFRLADDSADAGITASTLTASGQITSTVTTGTAPLVVASTTLVANLHAATADAAPPTGSAGGALSGSYPNPTLATAQPDVHTWALAQTFTTAPVFTDQSGSRTALGLGTMATQNANAVAITGGTITGMSTPTNPSDVAIKSYVDSIAAGLSVRDSVAAATAGVLSNTPIYSNGSSGVGATLTGVGFAGLVVDGYTASVGDRILIKNQVSAFQNGIYTVTATGGGAAVYILTRATDYDQSAEIFSGTYTLVLNGTTNADNQFVMTTAGTVTVGTTAINWTEASFGTIYSAGAGLSLSGTNQFSIPSSGVTNAMLAGSIASSKLVGTDITAVGALGGGSATTGFTINAALVTLSGQFPGSGVAVVGNASGSPSATFGVMKADGTTIQCASGLCSAVGAVATSIQVGSTTVTSAGGSNFVLTTGTVSGGTGTLANVAITAAFGTQTANTLFAGPTTGSAANPSFRAMVTADMPLFLQSGTGAVSRTYLSKNQDIINAKDYGVVCDGSTDDTTNAQAGLTAIQGNGGAKYVFPAGRCIISAALTYTQGNLTIEGQGVDTVFVATNATADLFTLSGAVGGIILQNFKVDATGSNHSAGVLFNFSNTSANNSRNWINNVYTNGGYDVVYFGGGVSSWVNASELSLPIRYAVHYGPSYAGLATISGLNGFATTSGGGTNAGAGILVEGGDTFNFANINFQGYKSGFVFRPAASTLLNNVWCTNCSADGVGRTTSDPMWVFDGSASGASMNRVHIANGWAGSGLDDGFSFTSVNAVEITNSHSIANNFHGFHLKSGSNDIRITNSTAEWNSKTATNTYSGFEVDNTVNAFTFIGNRSGPASADALDTQKYGVEIAGTTHNNYQVKENDLRGNLTGQLLNAGTGTTQEVFSNVGVSNSANFVLASPDGSGGYLTPRALVVGDIGFTIPFARGGLGITTGTSGGIPYFSSSAAIASSGALGANAIVVGGGAGAPPTSSTTWSLSGAVLTGTTSASFSPQVSMVNNANDNTSPFWNTTKSRAGGPVLGGDGIGTFGFNAYDTGSVSRVAAQIAAIVTTVGSGFVDGSFGLQTSRSGVLSNAAFVGAGFSVGTLNDYGSGNLNVAGSISCAAPVTKTGTSGSMGAADCSLIINASGSYTLTLQPAATYTGRWLHIKSIAAQTIVSASSNVVPLAGGSASTTLLASGAGKWADLQSDGANWIIMSAN